MCSQYKVIHTVNILDDTGMNFKQLYIPSGKVIKIKDMKGFCENIEFPISLLWNCMNQLEEVY